KCEFPRATYLCHPEEPSRVLLILRYCRPALSRDVSGGEKVSERELFLSLSCVQPEVSPVEQAVLPSYSATPDTPPTWELPQRSKSRYRSGFRLPARTRNREAPRRQTRIKKAPLGTSGPKSGWF